MEIFRMLKASGNGQDNCPTVVWEDVFRRLITISEFAIATIAYAVATGTGVQRRIVSPPIDRLVGTVILLLPIAVSPSGCK